MFHFINKAILMIMFVFINHYFIVSSQGLVSNNDFADASSGNIQFIQKKGLSKEACRRIAYDFLNSESDKSKSIPYFEFILNDANKPVPADIHALAEAYYHNDQFGLAIDLLNQYIETVKNRKQKHNAKMFIEVCKQAEILASDAENVRLVNLGPNINSRYDEINPFVSYQENILVYSSKKRKDYNIYVSKKKSNQTIWNKAKLAGKLINTIDDEFVAGLSTDGNTLMVHYDEHSGFEDINISSRVKGMYRELDDLGTRINSAFKEEGACFSKTGDTLFFASNRSGGFGGFDLYYSLKVNGKQWGKPINMGPVVNSASDENYPNIDPVSSGIYFSSKGHNSIGGYDLFYTKWDKEQGSWTKPRNLGYPINNTYDNKTIRFTESPRYAYISSILKHGYGNFDIYKVVFLEKEAEFLIVTGNVFVKDSIETKPFNNLDSELSISVYKNDDLYGIYSYNKRKNNFILALDPGTYYLEVEADKYKKVEKKFTIKENHYRNKRFKINIYLEPLGI